MVNENYLNGTIASCLHIYSRPSFITLLTTCHESLRLCILLFQKYTLAYSWLPRQKQVISGAMITQLENAYSLPLWV